MQEQFAQKMIEILNLFWAKLKHQSHHASGAWIGITAKFWITLES